MKQYLLSELTDSRLFYDKKPPKFLFFIIGLVFLFVCGSVATALFVHKAYVVKASGIIASADKSILTINISEKITTFNLTEGQAVQVGDIIMTFDDSQTRIQMEQYAVLAVYYADQIALYERCLNEINENTNTFDVNNLDEAVFFYQIQLYQNQLTQYTHTDTYYKEQGYTTKQIATQQEQSILQRESIKYQMINNLNTKKIALEAEMQSANAQAESFEELLGAYTVRAAQSGIVHLNGDVQPGMIFQSGTVIGSISSNSLKDLTVEAYVSTQDRAKIEKGSKVEISISGVLQNEYGILTGTIMAIDSDVTVNQDEGAVYYKVKIALDNTVLTNKSGKEITLSIGMVTQCNVKYKDSTWFEWALEQLGLVSVQ